MKVSIITVCYNTKAYIQNCVESILTQSHDNIEYIIVDGGSTDGTLAYLESLGEKIHHLVSEPDQGLYDAMNKGIALASGEIVGILNADDFYQHSDVIKHIVSCFAERKVDSVFGDLVYVNPEDLNKVVRYFSGKGFHPGLMSRGIMPPHPTFFVKREMYQQHGNFDLQYSICADFDLMVRLFVKSQISYAYLPEVMIKMRTGGSSTQGIKSTLKINQEMLQSCRSHGLSTNLVRIYYKYLTKVFQLVKKPPKLS